MTNSSKADLGASAREQHRKTKTPEYQAWTAMKVRCYAPSNPNYYKYGARGIKVCDRWRSSFSNFLEDMGKKPTPKHTLDRLDNDADYTPENCHWATPYQQTHNRRSTRAYRRRGTNEYIGVAKRKYGWQVCTRIGDYKVSFGTYKDPIEAAYVRDQVILQTKPDRAELNVLSPLIEERLKK